MNKKELINKLIAVDRIHSGISYADHIIVMSEILKIAILKKVKIKNNKFTVLGNRVDTALFKPLFNKKYRANEIKLLFIGRQEEQKNLHGVIAAINLLRAKKYKIVLYICGGGQQTVYTQSLLTKENKRFCKYLGAVKNSKLTRIYNMVDMLVNPSFFEGFQIPLIEALACGVPVVTSNQEPSNKIISNKIGALVEPADPADIAKGIEQIHHKLSDPWQCTQIKTACRIEALTKWDYYLVSKKEADVYLKVINENRAKNKL